MIYISLGIGGTARKQFEDESIVVYEYSAYNLNKPEFRNAERIFDGKITVLKSGLVEPEIHETLIQLPEGKRRTDSKRVRVSVPFEELLAKGMIDIHNSSFCWMKISGLDMVALHFCYKLFYGYQEQGCLPDIIHYNV